MIRIDSPLIKECEEVNVRTFAAILLIPATLLPTVKVFSDEF